MQPDATPRWDGTARSAALPMDATSRTTGPQGDDLEPLRKADPGRGLGWQYTRSQGLRETTWGRTRRRSICCSVFLPLQLAHHQSCRNVLPRARSPDPGIDSARKVGPPPSLQPPNQHARGSFSAAKRNTSLVHWVARLPMNQRPTTPPKTGQRPAWVFLGRVTLQRALPDLRAQATSLVASTSNGLPMWPWVHCQQLHDSVSLSTVDFACRGRWFYHVINSSQGWRCSLRTTPCTH